MDELFGKFACISTATAGAIGLVYSIMHIIVPLFLASLFIIVASTVTYWS